MEFQNKSKDYIFVGIQLILFLGFLWSGLTFDYNSHIISYLSILMMVLGFLIIIIAMLQLNKSLSPFPSPVEGSKLITNGVYSYIRHPIYLGIIIGGLGLGFYLKDGYKLILTCMLTVLFYFKSAYEESLLLEKFPEYSGYKKHTYRIIPFI